jgi:hypothetical protein
MGIDPPRAGLSPTGRTAASTVLSLPKIDDTCVVDLRHSSPGSRTISRSSGHLPRLGDEVKLPGYFRPLVIYAAGVRRIQLSMSKKVAGAVLLRARSCPVWGMFHAVKLAAFE